MRFSYFKPPLRTAGLWLGVLLGLLGAGVAGGADYPVINVSSVYDVAHRGDRALDGDPRTCWKTFKMWDDWQPENTPFWLMMNFGRRVRIERMVIQWGEDYPTEYALQVSDGKNIWKTIHRRKGGKGGREELSGLKIDNQWLRIAPLAPQPGRELFSIAEVEFPGMELVKELNARQREIRAQQERETETNRRQAAAELARFGVRELIFAAHPVVREHWYANFGYYAAKAPRYEFLTETLTRDGARLCRLELASGRLSTILEDPRGGIRDPQLHYGGGKILFSYRKGGSPYFHLYEINLDGGGLRQLTDGPFDDIEPTYAPDGGIVFVSSRCKRWVNCWMTHVAILYRCDADGGNLHPVSSNPEQDNTPWPLPDGRLLYTRWEYVDRSQVHYHHLWTVNPDGTGHTVYYGNQTSGTVMIDAKPIAGTDKIVASFSPGHGTTEHEGYVTVVDAKEGPDAMARARRISKHPTFRDPWALSEECFLAAVDTRIVLLNGKGEERTIFQLSAADLDAGLECHEPRPLLTRPRERVIPARVNLAATTGTMVLANVYAGRNMAGIKPGEIKKLLVLEVLPKPINYSGGMEPLTMGGSFALERVLGTVPVEADGSAWFEVPALRSLLFVALDGNDLSVKRMQSFASVGPGETLGCVGCHEQRTRTGAAGGRTLAALRRSPSRIEPIAGVPDVFDFPRDIQPILNRHCVSCHDEPRKVNLSGDRGPMYSMSYLEMVHKNRVADGRNQPRSNYPPRTLGSSASVLLNRLATPAHHGVTLTDRERKVLRLWIDAGAPFAGTYAALGTGMIGRYEQNNMIRAVADLPATRAGDEAIGRRCAGCHQGELLLPRAADHDLGRLPEGKHRRFNRHNTFNLTRPEKSLLLLGPLAASAGGHGACKEMAGDRITTLSATVFASPADPDYRKILGSIREAKAMLERIKRFDMPAFRPRLEWVREMKRFGVLAADLLPDAPIDVYATDRKYWESLWYRPAGAE